MCCCFYGVILLIACLLSDVCLCVVRFVVAFAVCGCRVMFVLVFVIVFLAYVFVSFGVLLFSCLT